MTQTLTDSFNPKDGFTLKSVTLSRWGILLVVEVAMLYSDSFGSFVAG